MKQQALGIDIGSHSVKAVLLRRKGDIYEIVRAGSAPLEELGHMEDSRAKSAKIAMIVRNLLKESKITGSFARTPATIAVAGKKTLVRYARVPPAPDWRLKMLIDYEIEGGNSAVGAEAGELTYDFRLLELPTAHVELAVIIALARNDLVESQCELLSEAGVNLQDITLTPFPLFNTFVHNNGNTLANDEKTYLLVDIGSENLNLVVQRGGKLFFARNISPAGRAFTEVLQDQLRVPFKEAEELKCSRAKLIAGGSETEGDPDGGVAQMIAAKNDIEAQEISDGMMPVVQRIASAIHSSIMYCRAQTRLIDLQIDRVVFTGGGSALPGLREELSKRLSVELTEHDALQNFDISPLPEASREDVRKNSASYATAIGLALSGLKPEAMNFSLVPKKVKERRQFFSHTFYLWLSAAALVMLVGLIGWSSLRQASTLEERVALADAKASENQQLKAGMESLLAVNRLHELEIGRMQQSYVSSSQIVAAFGALSKNVPPEVELTKMSVGSASASTGTREVLIEGSVMKKVKYAGSERTIQRADAHTIIGKLANDLIAEKSVFQPPPEPEPVILREILEPSADVAASFQLRLFFTRVTNEVVGTK